MSTTSFDVLRLGDGTLEGLVLLGAPAARELREAVTSSTRPETDRLPRDRASFGERRRFRYGA
ncbi:MAG: hypothetical protein M3292_09835, partial [Actinomycetota bacterium]|nr:hypothetical protein [Actinomycetota bacterium]